MSYKCKCGIALFIFIISCTSALYTYPLRFSVKSDIVITQVKAISINERIDTNIYKSDIQGLVNIVTSLTENGFIIELHTIYGNYIDYLLTDGNVWYRVIYDLNTQILYGFCDSYKNSYKVFENIDFQ